MESKPTLSSTNKQQNKEQSLNSDTFNVLELRQYYSTFIEKHNMIKGNLIEKKQIISIENKDSVNIINEIESEIQQLKDDFQNNAMFLIAYDKQNYIKLLDELDSELTIIKEILNPKKKFKFSKKSEVVKKQNVNQNENKSKESISIYTKDDLVVSNLENTIKIYNSQELEDKKNLIIENIQNSEIYIYSAFKSLFAKNICNSKIFIGGIAGGSHMTSIIESQIYLSTHQLRIHDSKNTLFAVIVNSNPIIENSSSLIFSDLIKEIDAENITKLKLILSQVNINEDNNNYINVQDFQWLKQEKSPNFTIKEEYKEKLVIKEN